MISASTVTLLLLLASLVEIGEYCSEVEEWLKVIFMVRKQRRPTLLHNS